MDLQTVLNLITGFVQVLYYSWPCIILGIVVYHLHLCDDMYYNKLSEKKKEEEQT